MCQRIGSIYPIQSNRGDRLDYSSQVRFNPVRNKSASKARKKGQKDHRLVDGVCFE